MTLHLLDASAVMALLTGEPGGREVADLLGANPSSISAVNLAEVVDQLTRIVGLAADEVVGTIGRLTSAGLTVVASDEAIGVRAGNVRAAHYDRSDAALSLADCVALATAVTTEAVVVSSDADLCRVTTQLGLPVHPIPNSRGVRPEH